MRTKLVAGNWKMNFTRVEAAAAVEGLVKAVDYRPSVEVLICPPYLALQTVAAAVSGRAIAVGAQDVFWATSGAFTGKVSASMLSDLGINYCIVGHSETRGRFGKLETPASTVPYFAETDETVNLKIKSLIYCSLTPILCVGEIESERVAGKTDTVIEGQLRGALSGLVPEELASLVVAYEPVWAIGTGKSCDAPEAGRVCRQIRGHLADILGSEVAEDVRILYGGSVKSSNSDEIFKTDGIDGGLVGGASLDPQEFARIVLSA